MKVLLIILYSVISLVVYPQTKKTQTENKVPEYKNLFDIKMRAGVSCFRIPAIVAVHYSFPLS